MNKSIYSVCCFLILFSTARAQDDVYPVREQPGSVVITNATIHVGNGQVIENGSIEMSGGKIIQVGSQISATQPNARIIDGKGKQVYPGLILPVTDLGLKEIANGVRGSNDYEEIGE